MKVITLCGSMRFFNEMQEIARELETKYGYCAITPIGGTSINLDKEAVENLVQKNCVMPKSIKRRLSFTNHKILT